VLDAAAAVAVLVRFSRRSASARTTLEVFELLADAAVKHAGADAAAVLEVEEGRASLAAARGLPPHLQGFTRDADTIGPELCRDLVARTEGLGRPRMLPLVAGGDLYGALVLLLREGTPEPEAERLGLAEGLADLAAIAVSRVVQFAELRASREALQRTEKLKALGQMAAGITHDVRNALSPLAIHCVRIKRGLSVDRERVQPAVEDAEAALAHSLEVLERLRDFSRQERERVAVPSELAAVLQAADRLLRPRLGPEGESGRLALRQEPAPAPAVLAPEHELVTVVVNLALNAIEAIGNAAGEVVLRCGSEEDGGFLEVADDGPGMPPEIERHVFEPFFTTKRRGTGLGLANVYAFVQRQGGRLQLTTAPGAGTCIRLWFPAV
jgi:signal transduction histidine kinase